MASGFVWITPPSVIARNIELYGERVLTAVKAIADYIALKMQDEARVNAPWTDRTGNARSGLFAVAESVSREIVEIYLSHGHTIEYGKWLELANGGRYAIVMPTLEANLPVIEQMLDELFRG